jgi:valyl-tRNA synthetase
MPDYEPLQEEHKWQDYWAGEKLFAFKPGKKIFSIDSPPPFTSGTLHMGHVIGAVWMDFAARYKRMRGFNVLLPQGFDCHGLPTELRVEKESKIPRSDREKFRAACEEWTTQAIAKMRVQYDRLGYSTDWAHSYETRSPEYKKLVQLSLLKFFEMGRVYREKHPVLWCWKCATALAKSEVGHVEKHSKLYHLKFAVEGGSITIATTRPEMIFACAGIFVHPGDSRYKKLVGKKARVPLAERDVPIMADEKVDPAFGTGAVYVCTFGDETDVKWQRERSLPVVIAIEENGRMSKAAGKFAGAKLEDARKLVAEELQAKGVLVKAEDIVHNVLSHTERPSCLAPIEFLPQFQWFIKLRDVMRDVVRDAGGMKWFPAGLKIRLVDWAEGLDWDWIISRQRIYGTPIPFWHCEKCGAVVPAKPEQLPVDTTTAKPPGACLKCKGRLVGTSDVCDCWVDSSVTPLVISKWLGDKKFFAAVYPNTLRQQGYEIIRTWAFYTILRCSLLTGKPPFKEVLLNGLVAGEDGRKMSKSYGNVVAPEAVLDKEGADSLRQWALMAGLGEDYPYSSKEIVYSSKFQKKYWNAARFAFQFVKEIPKKPKKMRIADKWVLHRLNSVINEATAALEKYEFAHALTPIRVFFWHDFCDNYLEMVKERLYKGSGDEAAAARYCLWRVLRDCSLLLAPFVPHVTEAVYQEFLKKFQKEKSVHLMAWPGADELEIDKSMDAVGEKLKAVIAAVRKFKTESQMAQNAELAGLTVYGADNKEIRDAEADLRETLKVRSVDFKAGTGKIAVLDFSVDVVK